MVVLARIACRKNSLFNEIEAEGVSVDIQQCTMLILLIINVKFLPFTTEYICGTPPLQYLNSLALYLNLSDDGIDSTKIERLSHLTLDSFFFFFITLLRDVFSLVKETRLRRVGRYHSLQLNAKAKSVRSSKAR